MRGLAAGVSLVQDARAQSVKVDDEAVSVDLADGRTIVVPLVWFPRLWHAARGSAAISRFSERGDIFIGRIWMRI
jgi:uncharacterized protein DUF2442